MTQVLPFCKDSKSRALNILVVGREEMIGPLSTSILKENKSSNSIFNLNIHKCENVKHILSKRKSSPNVDYIIFCLQSTCVKFIKQIEKNIGCLNKVFLLDRICLVLGLYGAVSYLDSAAIMALRQKYQLHVLNGRVNEEDCRQELSRRILRLVSFACGLHTGFPHVEYRHNSTEKMEDADNSDLSTSVRSDDSNMFS